ncbi:MAG: zf-HC2 domain-containing protein [Cellulosilyticaceae bacterium]
MRVTCDVIRDLLPLYVEGIASKDTCELVDAHIGMCETCKEEYEQLKMPMFLEIDADIEPFKKIKNNLRKKKRLVIFFTAMVVVTLMTLGMVYMMAPEYISYEGEVVQVEDIGEGMVSIKFDESVSGYEISKYRDDQGDGYVYHLTTWRSIWDEKVQRKSASDKVLGLDGEQVTAVYYYETNGMPDTLLYGKPIEGEGVVTLPRLFLTYYAVIAGICILGLSIVLVIVRKKRKIRQVMEKVLLVPIAYLLAHLCVKGFGGSSYAPLRDLVGILLVMVPLYIILYCGRQLMSKVYSSKN